MPLDSTTGRAEYNARRANPNLPSQFVLMNAYNLIPGVAFMLTDQPDPRVWIVERSARDADFERVSLWAHDGTNHEALSHEQAFNLDFMTQVALVGTVVNPTDHDDNDWGS